MRSSLEMMNGDDIDQYHKVAFLLWRTEKHAGYMMVVDMEGVDVGRCRGRMEVVWVEIVDGLMSWQC